MKKFLKELHGKLENTVREKTGDPRMANESTKAATVECIRVEEKLLESWRFIKRINDMIPDILYLHDIAEQRSLYSNKPELLGYAEEEMIRMGAGFLKEVMHPDDLPRTKEHMERCLRLEDGEILEHEYRMKHGRTRKYRWFRSCDAVFSRDSNGAPRVILGTARDITQHKEMEDKLRRTEHQFRQFAEALQKSNATVRAMAARLAETAEDERRRLSRELHDRIGQHLVALTLNLKAISNSLTAESEAKVRERLRDSAELLKETTGFIRDLMSELRPPDLDDYGLAAALRWYADRFSQRIGVPISVENDPRAPRLEPLVEISLFRIAQEALTNIARHASADRAGIALEILPGAVRLTIKDNGVGFDPAILQEPGGTRGWGLITMRERAEAMGGELRVESVPGKGARVVVELKRGSRGYTGISR